MNHTHATATPEPSASSSPSSPSESMRAALEAVAEMRAAQRGDIYAAERIRETVEAHRLAQYTSAEKEALAVLGNPDQKEIDFLIELRAQVKVRKCAAEGTPVFSDPEGDRAIELLAAKRDSRRAQAMRAVERGF